MLYEFYIGIGYRIPCLIEHHKVFGSRECLLLCYNICPCSYRHNQSQNKIKYSHYRFTFIYYLNYKRAKIGIIRDIAKLPWKS